jgi:HlyD family secretion protein
VTQLERDRSSLQAQLNSIDAQVRQVEQRVRSRRMGAEQTKLTLQELQTASKRSAQVTTLASGRVIELKKNVGDQVRTGEVIAVLEPLEGDLQPIIFVNSKLAKQIRPDMETQVSPTSVKKEEFGFMKGKVSSVSDFPITPEGAQAIVANRSLVGELLGTEAKVEMRAALIPNAATPSGYEWSSSSGPPFRIAGGSRISVSVVVDRKPPITYVLPLIKSKLGV